MTLEKMAEEYMHSANLCRKRVTLLQRELRCADMSRTEKLKMRRRICVLESMARQAASTGRYLANYYREDTIHEGNRRQTDIITFQNAGVSGATAVYKAV